ncbi:hypothetical protein GDO86_018709 [Hymenochirus boettgeri]|uniref:NAD(P)(+)--arginine ADP-ribosyltransferase n=1 Tax=Hymenochirus boettgeri TaxID=247094 RepID=A0A8T2IHY1_9PIPI|nr:hypothetical protein GDO86_018709 [Hymenochirus boettgeri]
MSKSPAIFDDQYRGCEDQMEKIITDGLLDKELREHSEFKSAWETAKSLWYNSIKAKVQPTLPYGFKDEYGIAIVAYTGSIYRQFNEAAREVGTSSKKYKSNFPFKSLHYYLTAALRNLISCTKNTVYRGVGNIHFMSPKEGNELRFGQFTSTSSNKNVALHFGNDSFFEIRTCYGVPIAKFSQYSSEEEVLVLGNEVFTVKSFDQRTNRFLLDSTQQTCSFFNCAYFEGQ